MYTRAISDIQNYLAPGKVTIIYGPRQVGKTTLIQNYLKNTSYKYRFEIGDSIRTQDTFASLDHQTILEFAEDYDLIAIDEAQLIPNIGSALKILVDLRPDIQVLVTGSSSFEFAGQMGEPLTGRKRTLQLYPLAILELQETSNTSEIKNMQDNLLTYGSYPEVLKATTKSEKQRAIEEITDSYLLKDIFEFGKVKSSRSIVNLLRLVAFQVGAEVSTTELASKLSIDSKTVSRYLDILEKSFVLVSLGGFSKNLRNEITKMNKYYFMDLGIRNAIISNFNPPDQRNDVGMMWENFLIIERLKKQSYQNIRSNNYFWRTWDQSEIDWIEEREGKLFGYEFKYSKNSRGLTAPEQWKSTYPEATYEVIDQNNFVDFVS